ncbi:MAG: flagellar basal-body rod protein FlgF [Alphaproteobacteria bacterium]|nr:flagellar basal-body rod protein FlgF [Alphaproteobacteria bacterium]
MENPSYIALSLMTGLHRQMEVVANNMANSSTPGFQGEKLTFRSMISPKAMNPGVQGAERSAAFVTEAALLRDTRAGVMERTGNTLDVGIVGDGYFAVQTDDGVRYTRHGSFRPDAQGQLILSNGARVLGDNGAPITLPAGDTNIEIDRRGNITGKDGTIGKLRVVKFENEQAMRKVGENMFETDADALPVDGRTELAQGMIEGSNVQPVLEVTQMIDLMRRFQSATRVLEQEHERVRRAIDKISRVA